MPELSRPPSPPLPLERRRLAEGAWRRYVQEGIEPAGIGDEISRSWRRSRESYRIDPALRRPIRALSTDALAERRARDEVLALASPVLREFSSRVDLTNHVLTFFDRDGWMLSIDGDRPVADQLAEIGFHPGTSWTEESAGTNGPGTALASGRPVEVFAAEHFVEAWHPWSCAAAPVRTPGLEAPVGLVDVTGPWRLQRREALVVAAAIACAIEERLRAAAGLRDEVVRYALRAAHESGDALVAVDAHGRVIAANDAATRRRMVSGGSLRAGICDAFADAFRSRSVSDVRLESPDGLPVVVSTVRYDDAPVGAILRIAGDGAVAGARRSRARARPSARYDFECILGEAPPFLRALQLARTAARNDLPAVLTGESGTGKELVAHAIHAASARKAGPFVAVNCGSLPAQLVESELFGYEAGAFTGARQEGSPGRFETADGGTLFLDEVSELPPQAQTALLRVLQEREIVRLGSSVPRPVDVRIVAATNRRLEDEIAANRFRRDLYYRLNVLAISLPPLRERGDDVLALARVFLSQAEGEVGREGLTLAPDALRALRAHRWPGNVRELRNAMLRAAATAQTAEVGAQDLLLEPAPADARAPASRPSPEATGTLRDSVRRLERSTLLETLEACEWNIARAAAQLGASRMTLYRMLKRYGISRHRPAR